MVLAKVAVITRTKNRPTMLRRAMLSVLAQTFKNWHHYIVNDGGNASTVSEAVREYEGRYDGRVTVIHNPASFTMEAASDVGILAGNEEYLTIHDDDDTWEPAFLDRTVSRLDPLSEDPEYGGVVTQARVIVERMVGDDIKTISSHIFNEYTHIGFADMLKRNWYPPICLVFRRIAMEQVGLYDTTLPVLGDWDFHLRLYRKFKVEVIPEPLANYHHRPGGGDASNSVYKDAGSHQRYNVEYIDRIIKTELESGDLSYGDLMMHARTAELVDRLNARVNEVKNDIVWELKRHIDWRLGVGEDQK
jgi:glycosyltransferase involved in cell wall biosynthesis